jgi:hypothetical protein
MAAQSLGEYASSFLPSGSSMMQFFLYAGVGFIVIGLIATATYLIIQKKKYNKTIMIWRIVAGKPEWTDTTKAQFQRIGLAGDYWVLCKNGKILSRPQFEQRKGIYFYHQGLDGELRNFRLENIDETLKEAKVVVLKEDMRLTRIAIEKNLKDRLQKPSWWQENKSFVTNMILVLIIMISVMYLLNKVGEIVKVLAPALDRTNELANRLANLCSNVPNLASGVKL